MIAGHMPRSLREFLNAPIHPPSGRLSGPSEMKTEMIHITVALKLLENLLLILEGLPLLVAIVSDLFQI